METIGRRHLEPVRSQLSGPDDTQCIRYSDKYNIRAAQCTIRRGATGRNVLWQIQNLDRTVHNEEGSKKTHKTGTNTTLRRYTDYNKQEEGEIILQDTLYQYNYTANDFSTNTCLQFLFSPSSYDAWMTSP